MIRNMWMSVGRGNHNIKVTMGVKYDAFDKTINNPDDKGFSYRLYVRACVWDIESDRIIGSWHTVDISEMSMHSGGTYSDNNDSSNSLYYIHWGQYFDQQNTKFAIKAEVRIDQGTNCAIGSGKYSESGVDIAANNGDNHGAWISSIVVNGIDWTW